MAEPAMAPTAPRRLGIALGGGAALGLAHIGVLRTLRDRGIEPDIVAGTSIGSVIGSAYVFGQLDRVERNLRDMTWLEMMRLVDFRIGRSGLIGGEAVVREIRRYIGDSPFEAADRPFAVVAADLVSDGEVTFTTGPVVEAVRASISLPGIFTPVPRDGMLLIDGGLQNPVPVSTCHALGADLVIAVNVLGDYEGQATAAGIVSDRAFRGGITEVLNVSIGMVTRQLARTRFLTNPPDVLVLPRVGHLKQYDFKRASELIAAGEEAIEAVWPEIEALRGRLNRSG